jgi:hypothetical protein
MACGPQVKKCSFIFFNGWKNPKNNTLWHENYVKLNFSVHKVLWGHSHGHPFTYCLQQLLFCDDSVTHKACRKGSFPCAWASVKQPQAPTQGLCLSLHGLWAVSTWVE